ncbi:hypothetical protein HOT29_gp007 [Microbacterium phage Squash]|uniref:Uncharacterized protein n=1 Tax=Microbacterium phage Squash TaxID=2182357 RepID=A0A2U8UMG8_9CAUD|nr:hypothetical protein HOT29_gp007 [Microbacterium phage Squash]AWN04626.1 hypothetical protein PBI_SQUASH_7 [Microbacterium phage Squash]QIQ63591.1 hypothetical protein SEA_NIKE_6 [Microbacterium phage Nike]
MKDAEFSVLARLGQTAVVRPPWTEPYEGRVVALTNPRYGAHIRASDGLGIRYTDCVWITALRDSDGQIIWQERL